MVLMTCHVKVTLCQRLLISAIRALPVALILTSKHRSLIVFSQSAVILADHSRILLSLILAVEICLDSTVPILEAITASSLLELHRVLI